MIALAICATLGVIFGLGLWLGACIHAVSPTDERPIRHVKARGEIVDMVL